MFGLRTPCTITRQTITGQGSDGAPIFANTTVFTGRCLVEVTKGDSTYERSGLTPVSTNMIYLPNLKGTATPLVGDQIVAAGSTYDVEFVTPDPVSHHLEILGRLVLH